MFRSHESAVELQGKRVKARAKSKLKRQRLLLNTSTHATETTGSQEKDADLKKLKFWTVLWNTEEDGRYTGNLHICFYTSTTHKEPSIIRTLIPQKQRKKKKEQMN